MRRPSIDNIRKLLAQWSGEYGTLPAGNDCHEAGEDSNANRVESLLIMICVGMLALCT